MKVEGAVLGSASVRSLVVSVDVLKLPQKKEARASINANKPTVRS